MFSRRLPGKLYHSFMITKVRTEFELDAKFILPLVADVLIKIAFVCVSPLLVQLKKTTITFKSLKFF